MIDSTDCDDASVIFADVDGDTFGAGAPVACNGVASSNDCDDSSNAVYPGALENCANLAVDNNCDLIVTDAEAIDSVDYFVDGDSDLFGAGLATKSCVAIVGSVINSTDCDDADASINPSAIEDCANLAVDNNCDLIVTDAEAIDSIAYFVDSDNDGFGAGLATKSCSPIAGSVIDSTDCDDASVIFADVDLDTFGAGAPVACNGVASSNDCDDSSNAVYPGALENCANLAVDNNCDLIVTDAEAIDSVDYFVDGDSDLFGAGLATKSCSPIAGSVVNSTDCDDSSNAVYPGALENCANLAIDNNCDLIVTDAEAIDSVDYFVDGDSDLFGAGLATKSCSPIAGSVVNSTDCDDSSNAVYPGALENCANLAVDNNCDLIVTDAEAIDSIEYFVDSDNDGFGAGLATKSCSPIAGSVIDSTDCDDASVIFADVDLDTFGAGAPVACNGVASSNDCDDSSNAVYPGALENCANLAVDNNCDLIVTDAEAIDSVDYFVDGDSDLFGAGLATKSCVAIVGSVINSTDCDDADASINPSAIEDCANLAVDNNCDLIVTDAEAIDSIEYFVDSDNDGFGAGLATKSCSPIAGSVIDSTDCDDASVIFADVDLDTFGAGAPVACNGVASSNDCDDSSNAVYPGALENCANLAVDNNCDLIVTDAEAVDSVDYFVDGDSDLFGAGLATKSCVAIVGSVANSTDCDDADASINPSAIEDCANLAVDNNCDLIVTDAEAIDSIAYFVDSDNDGFGAGLATKSCSPIAGSVIDSTDCDDASVIFADVDLDTFGAGAPVACNGVASSTDCDDSSNAVYPGALENCANLAVDNNCDLIVTDAEAIDSVDYFVDGDSDLFGAGLATKSCVAIVGSVINSTDCDDADASINPSAIEDCANLAVDNNCDLIVTDAEAIDSIAYFVDSDNDGFGAGLATKSCSPIAGSVIDSTDCDDASVIFADVDGDTFGAGAPVACNGVASSNDCDDSSNAVYPGALENCANLAVDNNCDLIVTDAEAVDSVDYFVDGDNDGFGAGLATKSCVAIVGSVINSTDCDDADASINPSAIEDCANLAIDNNCNLIATDEEAVDSIAYFVDSDNDGFGAGLATKSCSPIAGSVIDSTDCDDASVIFADVDGDTFGAGAPVACNGVASSTDCDDSSNAVYPGALENCANLAVDNNCDLIVTDAEAIDSVDYFVDGDSDLFGAGLATKSCSPIAGSVVNSTDCDDADASINPSAIEDCANLAVDNNCDLIVTDAEAIDSIAYFVDSDNDGFGAGLATKSCSPIAGSVIDSTDCDDASVIFADVDGDTFGAGAPVACNGVASSNDCDDSSNAVYPGALENCANLAVDNNCDLIVTDAEAIDSVDYFVDGDSDLFGAGLATKSCVAIVGSVINSTDCDDADASINPSAIEDCANLAVDNNCDLIVTDAEAIDSIAYFVDGDNDGFGAGLATKSCSPIVGSVIDSSDCDDASVIFADVDGDTFGAGAPVACNGVASSNDCDDSSNAVYPGALENCANLAVDNNCDLIVTDAEAIDSVDYFVDGDSDLFGAGLATKSCSPIAGSVANSTDCDDADASINPSAIEDCANLAVDNNCDLIVTDAEAIDSIEYFVDSDNDGFGAGLATKSCSPIAGSVIDSTDCDDASVIFADVDGDTFGAGAPVACNGVASSNDCDDSSNAVYPGALENCANLAVDNNCDLIVTDAEAIDSVDYFVDGDSDLFGAGLATKSCSPIVGSVANSTDCDDADASINPSAIEDCANLAIDNNCNLIVTEEEAVDSIAYFVDSDNDGFGAGLATKSCVAIVGSVINSTDCDDASVIFADVDLDTFGSTTMVACNGVASSNDCDDSSNAVYPGALENCANIAVDNNCDLIVTDTEAVDSISYFVDGDSDLFGAGLATKSCSPIVGSVANSTDCDDAAASINPSAIEDCANIAIDNNCNLIATDEEAVDSISYCNDTDNDGFGAGAITRSCTLPAGMVANGTDCNDESSAIFPTAIETCANDGVDNNCNGINTAAEAIDSTGYYPDLDGDGFGAGAVTMSCTAVAGSVSNATDCNDSAVLYTDADGDGFGTGSPIACDGAIAVGDCNDASSAVNPNAIELCADLAVDNNCNGSTDETEATDRVTFYADTDSDTFGDSAVTALNCVAPAGFVIDNTDGCPNNAQLQAARTYFADTDSDTFGNAASSTFGLRDLCACRLRRRQHRLRRRFERRLSQRHRTLRRPRR